MIQEEYAGFGKPAPFKTTDAVLAFCLYNALGRSSEQEAPVNIFTPEILGRLGYKGEILTDARKAWQRGDRGSVEYCFDKQPDPASFQKFVDIYNDQISRLKEGDGDVADHLRELIHLAADGDPENKAPWIILRAPGDKMDEREASIRIYCTVLKTRAAFMDRWRQRPARLRTYDPQPPEEIAPLSGQRGATRTRQQINFREFPLDMSDEKLQEAGLL